MKYGIIFFKDFIPKKKRQAREKTVPNMQKNISLDIFNLFLMILFKSIIKNTS